MTTTISYSPERAKEEIIASRKKKNEKEIIFSLKTETELLNYRSKLLADKRARLEKEGEKINAQKQRAKEIKNLEKGFN